MCRRKAARSSARLLFEVGKLSGISGKQAVKAFGHFGYEVDHQTGSHMILYHPERLPLSIPNHRELAPGLLRGLLRKAEIDVDEFLRIVNRR
jgi:predicted RNA binding protein YcfA (HicA-like mRNA interferase family)